MAAHSIAPWIKFDEKMWFEPGKYRGCRKRIVPVTVSVNHWTGSQTWGRTHKNVYNVLRARKPDALSIHFTTNSDGEIYQMADCEKTVCFHAGAVNEFSVGNEIISPGLWREGMDPKVFTKLELYVHGRMVKQVAYKPAQLEAVVKLSEVLHQKLGIKNQIPAGTDMQILTEVMLASQRQKFEGFIEHLHCSSKKLDGGTQISRALLDTGRYTLVRP